MAARVLEALGASTILCRHIDVRKGEKIREYFTGTGYLTRWLMHFGVLSTVDKLQLCRRELESFHSVEVVEAEAVTDIACQKEVGCIVAHGGLHDLADKSSCMRKALILEEAFVRLCIKSLRDSGLLFLVDVPAVPYLLQAQCPKDLKVPYSVQLMVPDEVRCLVDELQPDFVMKAGDDIVISQGRLTGAGDLAIPRIVLEEFVDRYRVGGHRGAYSDLESWRTWAEAEGGELLEAGYLSVPWLFLSRGAAARFVKNFFRLEKFLGDDDALTMELIERGLLVSESHLWMIPWTIQYMVARRRKV